MSKKITSKSLVPVVGALGVAFLMGGMGGCGHRPPARLQNMGPLSAQSEVVHTVNK